MRAEDLRAASNLSYRESFATLARHSPRGEVLRGQGFTAFITGAPIAMFNGCVVGGPTSRDELELVVAWLDERPVPYEVSIDCAVMGELEQVMIEHGFVRDEWLLPGMAMRPPSAVPAAPRELSIVRATGSEMQKWLDVILAGGLPPQISSMLFPPSLGVDPDVTLLAGLVDGYPVSSAAAVRSGEVCGVYAVTTAPEMRRRGIGTAMTWAAAGCARDWDSRMVVLQASEMGFGAYSRMGFKTAVEYAVFNRPARAG